MSGGGAKCRGNAEALNYISGYICQSRDCNLVESQILLVETPIGVSTSRVPDWDFYR